MAWSQSSPVSKRGYDLAAVSPSSVHLGVVSVDVLAREPEHLGVVGAFEASARMVCSRAAAPRELRLALGRRHGLRGARHGRASSTRLNGVSAARRNRSKPPALTTSPILAWPACAPSASPTSCESEAGVHRSIENP